MHSKPPHLSAGCIPVNTTGVIPSASSHPVETVLVPGGDVVAGDLLLGSRSPGEEDAVGGEFHCAVVVSMPDIERPRLGRRAVHRDPLCAV